MDGVIVLAQETFVKIKCENSFHGLGTVIDGSFLVADRDHTHFLSSQLLTPLEEELPLMLLWLLLAPCLLKWELGVPTKLSILRGRRDGGRLGTACSWDSCLPGLSWCGKGQGWLCPLRQAAFSCVDPVCGVCSSGISRLLGTSHLHIVRGWVFGQWPLPLTPL